jgi:hypothetical protein
MRTVNLENDRYSASYEAPREDVVKVTLMLPGWQMAELQDAAQAKGISVAALTRSIISDFVSNRQDLGRFSDLECFDSIDDR